MAQQAENLYGKRVLKSQGNYEEDHQTATLLLKGRTFDRATDITLPKVEYQEHIEFHT